MAPDELDRLSREDLIARARVLGVERAQLMTRVELKDEIIRRSEPDAVRRQRSRGWLGVARDLVASVVEAGLNMRDAASLIRGEGQRAPDETGGPAPVATVTLAEIYAAQGHFDRALDMLEQVLEREPDHEAARALRERLRAEREVGPASTSRRRRAAEPAAASERTEAAAETPAARVQLEEPPAEETEPSEPAASAVPEQPATAPEAPPDAGVQEAVLLEPVSAEAVEAPAAEPEQPALVVVREGDRAYLYWEVPSRLRAGPGNGAEAPALVARAVSFRPLGAQPARAERDFEPVQPVGGVFFGTLEAGQLLRAALGYRERERFRPLAVASELVVTAAGAERQFCPLGSDPVRLGSVEARAAVHLKNLRGA